MDFEKLFEQNKQTNLSGRYITLSHIEPILNELNVHGEVKIVGHSVLGKPIYCYSKGTGKTKILLWSQMHGNESTTTKALFDLFRLLESESETAAFLLQNFSFCFIPILNPDGAERYTRVNANGIDLNRDSQDLSQPESKVLRQVYENFKPDYCYNLHDQRTIFAVGETNKPATVSFLAPSYNEEREFNEVRLRATNVIVAMNKTLQGFIPGQVGRFDDAFNLNCIGDTMQFFGTPTILFEAGHYPDDYEREETRKYVFFALLSSLSAIYENVIVDNVFEDYMNIPQNKAAFFDFVYKNIKINYDSSEIITNFAAQYNEELINNTIIFNAFVVKIGDLDQNFGHIEFDGMGKNYSDDHENFPSLNQKANFFIDKNIKIVNGKVVI